MSTAATAYGPQQEDRAGESVVAAGPLLRGIARFVRVLVDELKRIPTYQDEAERIRQGLRRG